MDIKGRALWSSFSARRVRSKLKIGARAAARAAALIMAVTAGTVAVSATPELWPRLVLFSAAASSPGAALELLEERWTVPPPEAAPAPESSMDEPVYEEAAPASEQVTPEESTFREEPESSVPEVSPENRGSVLTQQYSFSSGGIYVPFGAALIRNGTENSAAEIESMLTQPAALTLEHGSAAPQVLIYHTHTTESYEPDDRGYYDVTSAWRSTDNSQNMAAVGEELAAALKAQGISVLHDTTQHDSPSYNGSYVRSAATVREYLAAYPSIKLLLDLHRDAIEPEENVIIKPTATIRGRKAAQIMVLCGCDDGTMNMPGYWDNLRLAASLTGELETRFPGLTRPVYFAYNKYNMDLSPNLLLVEVGSSGNTLEEAKYSARLLAEAIVGISS